MIPLWQLFLFFLSCSTLDFPGGSEGKKNLPAMQETWIWSLGWKDALEKGMATHSSILAWRIPLTEEPGGLQSMGSQKVDRTEWLSLSLSSLSQPKIWVQILILCLRQWILKQFLKLQMALLKIQDINNNVSSLQSTHVSNAYFYYKTNPKVQATPDQLSALKTKTES